MVSEDTMVFEEEAYSEEGGGLLSRIGGFFGGGQSRAATPSAPVTPRIETVKKRIEVSPGVYATREKQVVVQPAQTRVIPESISPKQPKLDFASPDELWILVRPGATKQVKVEDLPRAALIAHVEEQENDDEPIELPLQHTKVRAAVAGILNTVQVSQQYENPFEEKIEVTYQFPLPTDAAVTDFIMTVGDRTIRGIIREKEEAKKIYRTARASGYVASLMTQERPNIFEQKVANIEPGKRIDLDITYFNALQLVDGYYEFTFPMTIGPRYNPVGTSKGIGASLFGKAKSSQPTTISYLPAGKRSGNDIDLEIDLNAGMAIQDLKSPTHKIDRRVISDSHQTIRLAANDQIPNRDFVLRYRLASDEIQTAFLRNGDHFVALVEPPDDIRHLEKQAREMIFVVDCSGSMSGEPMTQAKATMRKAIRQLDSDDTFAILRFSESASSMSEKPLPATRRNIAKGLKYIDKMSGYGGTDQRAGIKAALNFPREKSRQRVISFMTDGYIGNEAEIFNILNDDLADDRVFSFGIGSSVNRYLIEGLARHGKGAAAFIGLGEDPTWVVDSFYNRIAYPAVMNPSIEWNGLAVDSVYPSRLPDLLPGRPLLITGRCAGPTPLSLTLKGTVGGEEVLHRIPINPARATTDHEGLASIWARQRIEAMHHHEITNPEVPIKQELTDFSIENSVLSKYTAFVAVDSATQTDSDDPGIEVQQPNVMPEGVKHETTIGQVFQPAPAPAPLPQPALVVLEGNP